MKKKKVAFSTLGCKLNFTETDTIINKFLIKGYEYVKYISFADIYIINTCSVTNNAEKKLKKLVKIALKNNVNAFIVAIGCYSQVNPKKISLINGIDLIIGAKKKFKIINYLENINLYKKKTAKIYYSDLKKSDLYFPSYSKLNRTRSFLKIQDGCDYKCSYCTIPKARGTSKSDEITNIIKYAKNVIKKGIKEIVLTGVNIGDFGKNLKPKSNLLELMKAMDSFLYEKKRIRISSIEPNLLNDDIINFILKSKIFVHHFHIPLQSGSDEILNKMKRRYSSNLFEKKIIKIKNLMPNACIGSDVIVGFPGEQEKNFIETYLFLSKLDISYFHVFSYSERINTEAISMKNSIPQKIRYKRSKILRILSKRKKYNFYYKNINKKKKVLFEKKNKSGYIYGYTDNFIRTKTTWKSFLINQIKKVTLLNIDYLGNMICH
ncbi:MAG: tRNA (N(6)-L-threonylcarbamoyladenosine(37)-C(2))-methylthiotransferase MtaB [Candidatus Karelsulcia muelleri]